MQMSQYMRSATAVFFACAVALTFFLFFVNSLVKSPIITDEVAYLAQAAALAGHLSDMATSYHSGYSFLLVPVFILTNNPIDAWRIVQITNSILFFFLLLSLWRISFCFRANIDDIERLIIVLIVSIYPSWVVMSGYAFPQIALALLFNVTFLFVNSAIKTKSYILWFGVGALAGTNFWMHPTGIVSGVAIALAGLVLTIFRPKFIYFFMIALLATISAIIIFLRGIAPSVNDLMRISEFPGLFHYSISYLFSNTNSIAEMAQEFIGKVIGHLLSLTISTLGALWMLWRIRHVDCVGSKKHEIANWIHKNFGIIFAFLSLAISLCLSAFLFTIVEEAERLDHWFYGRYTEVFLGPVLIYTLIYGCRSYLKYAVVFGGMAILIMGNFIGEWNGIAYFNAPGMWPLRFAEEWDWRVISGLALMMIYLLIWLPRKWVIATVIIVFVFSITVQKKWQMEASAGWLAAHRVAFETRNFVDRYECLGFDVGGNPGHRQNAHMLFANYILFDASMTKTRSAEWFGQDNCLLLTLDDALRRDDRVVPLVPSDRGGLHLLAKLSGTEAWTFPLAVVDASWNWSLGWMLLEGWHGLEPTHVWSGRTATLRVPRLTVCGREECEVVLEFLAFGASPERPVSVLFEWGLGHQERLTVTSSEPIEHGLSISTVEGAERVRITVDPAVSPQALLGTEDPRTLGIALLSVDVRTRPGPEG